MYLLRHGATEANLDQPYRLQGCRSHAGLAPLGVRQAELTRDLLAIRPIAHFYSSPLQRAVQTAKILAAPRQGGVQTLEALAECDIGRWEGLSWETIRTQDAEAYRRFLEDPAVHGYPEGETFTQAANRAIPVLDQLLDQHRGGSLLVVGHHLINRFYLARLLGLPVAHARRLRLHNCGISIIVQQDERPQVVMLNGMFHLQGAA
jgi:broad specificity phosphatase PhoE